ncbi:GAF domain-containing protein [Ktedonobacter robiniae]|uniref:histidine kinase n=1 Tax=Ktedonobacter robiniae TaxID=2778365 RepID=A0ABQ3UPF4_9CHLR|nr:GAF domain-containing protein [Ktedonobacter robiniae]GHO54556.1 hypothetical protein KSB_30310 [Ktedonobacter robiniae]
MRSPFSSIPLAQLAQRLTAEIYERGNLAEALLHIAEQARALFTPDICILTAYHPVTGTFHYARALYAERQQRDSSPAAPRAHILREETIAPSLSREVQEIQPEILYVSDLRARPLYHSDYTRAEQVHSLISFALSNRPGHPPFAMLTLAFRELSPSTSLEEELLKQFSRLATFVLQETWMLQRYREVTHIGQVINQEVISIDTLLPTLYPLLNNLLDARHALMLAIYQAPTHTRDLYGIDEGNAIREGDRPPSGASKYVLQTRRPVLVEHLSSQAQQLPFHIAPVRGTLPKESFIFVPLLLGEIPLGVLSVQHPHPYAYTHEDMAILQVLGNHILMAINNIRLYDSLTQLNEAGRLLTSQLHYPLREIIERIQIASGAKRVVLKPTLVGTTYDPTPPERLLSGEPSHILKHDPLVRDWQEQVTEHMTFHPHTLFEPTCSSTREPLLKRVRLPLVQEGIKSLAIVPLRVDVEAVGVLFIFYEQSQYFDRSQKLLIEGLAHFAAIAIRNAQTFNSLLQRRVRELEILQRIDKELNSTLDLEALLETLLHQALTYVPVEGACIMLYDRKKQTLEAKAAYGTHAVLKQPFKIPFSEGRGLTNWAIHYKRSVRVDNVHSDAPWSSLYINKVPDTNSELDIPLLNGEQAIGVLNFESTRIGAFHQEDQEFLETLAGQAVLAIAKAQAYEREKRLANERQALYAISKELTSQLETKRVFALILDKALELMQNKSRTGCLMLYDREEQVLWMAAERGVLPDKKGREHSVNEGIVGQVARTRQLLNIDPSQPGWKEIYLRYIQDTRSELAVPMLVNGELKGVLNIESPEEQAFDESDERLLQGLADLAIVALRNAELYQEAEKEKQHFALLYRASRELGELNDISQLEQGYQIVFQLAEHYSQSYVELCRYDEHADALQRLRFSAPGILHEHGPISTAEQHYQLILKHHEKIIIGKQAYTSTSQPEPRDGQAMLLLPIRFDRRLYGTLTLVHREAGHFGKTDIEFYDSLAQQLGSTIYRLEVSQARLESEQRARAAEEVSLIGQSAFELTHRLGNDLGLVETYISSIKRRLDYHHMRDEIIESKLDKTEKSVRTVLDLSTELKEVITDPGPGAADEKISISPRTLLESAILQSHIPAHIEVYQDIAPDAGHVHVREALAHDILRNLINNAIEAMQQQPTGRLSLRAYNQKDKVAIQVSDNGKGIEPHIKNKVFSLFYSTKGSSGFGLWSARRNALRQHGYLWFEDNPDGPGVTFTLLLPKE